MAPPSTASTTQIVDVESPQAFTRESDPLSLSAALKSPAEITSLTARHRAASSWTSGRILRRKKSNEGIELSEPGTAATVGTIGQASGVAATFKNRKVDANAIKGFYESQNEAIERLLKSVEDHRREAKDEKGDTRVRYLIASYGSFAANIILAILQLYGAISSGSLSLFTTMADSVFDPLSNLLLILSHRAINKVDANRFPSGKARLETAGNIVFCGLMCAVSLILIVMSARDIASHTASTEVNSFHLPSIIAVSIAFFTKLGLFFYCWSLRNIYSQVHILWEDHRNDLLINGFGILTSIGGSKLRWWIDPMGALLLSCLISGLWSRTAYREFQLLIGVTADNGLLQLITYISMTHSPMISQIDTVRAYHSGPRIIVEVDIVMAPSETLRATHDVAEELQVKLESLPDVERAYVHVDYETSHKPEHFLKKEL
ncbi:hypothetical protein RUND412_006638 [Rhizina undulata]